VKVRRPGVDIWARKSYSVKLPPAPKAPKASK
jgi:hypothetical protein